MTAMKDVGMSLDRSKDEIQRHLTAVSIENEQLQSTIRKLEADKEMLLNQARNEGLKVERLEHLIAVERTRKIQTEKTALELQSTRNVMDDQLKHINDQQKAHLSSLNSELRMTQEENIGLLQRIEDLESKLRVQKQGNFLVLISLSSRKFGNVVRTSTTHFARNG